jgi:hypothetical protein
MHERDSQICKSSIIAKRRFNLRGQLARWLEYQTPERAVFCEQREDGKSKGRGLTGAGLGGPDQIFTGQHNRKRAKLNGRWLDKSHRLRPAHDFRRKSKAIK